ncbi:hypothetical protein JQK87_14260 [Streptomyces sp. G44]|uniref:hypothetical protein n=1 Tax=Streptomyces sp. G44 TaxID=2807632 RepID=UPI001960A1F3|nr:hypothetical protein [Streptomyces sp. G44]MBM7169556.1 hypothetical protein [Streptomyces sp. G44]
MNDTPNPDSTTQHPDSDLVQVALDDCSPADADTVFTVLNEHFPSDRGYDAPHQTGDARPAVWTGVFCASHTPESLPGVLLAGSVTADLQGGPVAVNRVRAALESAFEAKVTGTVSGDQEVQTQMRLRGAERGEQREKA